MGCGKACAAPKPAGDDPSPSLDAAPTSGEVPSRCEVEGELATGKGALEIGRMALRGTRALLGVRKNGRAMIADVDVAQPAAPLKLDDLAPAAGEAPPPMPLIAGDRSFSIGYEADAAKRLHLVVRDLAAPATAAFELPPEPSDESLAFDALATDAGVVVAWDAPADEASAVFAATLAPGKAPVIVRVSPAGVDADTPRLAKGPTGTLVVFLAHRALPKTDAAALPEGPGQDPEHVWLEMTSLDNTQGAPAHLTAESGSVASYDVVTIDGSSDFDVVARDGVELGAGQGGKLLLVAVQKGSPTPSVPIAEHVGRGVPALFLGRGDGRADSLVLFNDPTDRGRSSLLPNNAPATVAFEPALDGARPLGALPSPDPGWLRIVTAASVPSGESTALRILRCKRALRTNGP